VSGLRQRVGGERPKPAGGACDDDDLGHAVTPLF